MQIHGNRVTLKVIEESDLPNIQSLWNNGDVMKWVNFPNGLNISLDNLQKWYARLRASETDHEFVVLRSDGTFCGETFYSLDGQGRAGLDIKLLPHCQGQGLAKETLQLLINHIFTTEPTAKEVWTEPSEANTAARKLYTTCGLSSKERPADMEPADSYWALTREEWAEMST